jgi:hypothetical protein
MLNVKKGFIAAHTFSILTRYAALNIELPVRWVVYLSAADNCLAPKTG